MKRCCIECPHIVKNQHNKTIVAFAQRHNKKHNCHMTTGKVNLWTVTNPALECYASSCNLIKNNITIKI